LNLRLGDGLLAPPTESISAILPVLALGQLSGSRRRSRQTWHKACDQGSQRAKDQSKTNDACHGFEGEMNYGGQEQKWLHMRGVTAWFSQLFLKVVGSHQPF